MYLENLPDLAYFPQPFLHLLLAGTAHLLTNKLLSIDGLTPLGLQATLADYQIKFHYSKLRPHTYSLIPLHSYLIITMITGIGIIISINTGESLLGPWGVNNCPPGYPHLY